MELDTIFGLPAHPLVVHAAVVLVPLASLGLIAVALSARVRRHIGWYVAALAVVGAVFTFVAVGSGEPLEERVQETEAVERHAELGEQTEPFAVALALVSLAVVGAGQFFDRPRAASVGAAAAQRRMPAAVNVGLIAVSLVVGTLATVWVTRTGHAGAEATWQSEVSGGESGSAGVGVGDEDRDED